MKESTSRPFCCELDVGLAWSIDKNEGQGQWHSARSGGGPSRKPFGGIWGRRVRESKVVGPAIRAPAARGPFAPWRDSAAAAEDMLKENNATGVWEERSCRTTTRRTRTADGWFLIPARIQPQASTAKSFLYHFRQWSWSGWMGSDCGEVQILLTSVLSARRVGLGRCCLLSK